jgi:predicted ABC-class ATPase
VGHRQPAQGSFDASRGKHSEKVSAKGRSTLQFGHSTIDLSGLEQLVEAGQTRAIGQAILYFAREFSKDGTPLKEGLEQLEKLIGDRGLDVLVRSRVGDLVRPRLQEIAAAINRMRTLEVKTRS